MANESVRAEDPSVVRKGRWGAAGRLLAGAVTGLLVLGVGLIGGFVAGKQASAPGGGGHGEGAPRRPVATRTRARRAPLCCTPQTLGEPGHRDRRAEGHGVRPLAGGRGGRRRASGCPPTRVLAGGGRAPTRSSSDPARSSRRASRSPRSSAIRFPRPTLTLTDSLLRGPRRGVPSRGRRPPHVVARPRTRPRGAGARAQDHQRLGYGRVAPDARRRSTCSARCSARERGLENAREEARRHGLTVEEVAGIEAGTSPGAAGARRPSRPRRAAPLGPGRRIASSPCSRRPCGRRRSSWRSSASCSPRASSPPELEEALRPRPAIPTPSSTSPG